MEWWRTTPPSRYDIFFSRDWPPVYFSFVSTCPVEMQLEGLVMVGGNGYCSDMQGTCDDLLSLSFGGRFVDKPALDTWTNARSLL
jgi:hypothetical protein